MANWIYGKPAAKHARAIVLVDWDNFAIRDGDTRPWTPMLGDHHPEHLLQMVRALAGDIGHGRPLVFVFVNMFTGRVSPALESACNRYGCFLVHCPREQRRDRVDDWLSHALYRLEPNLQADQPFAVVTADYDFAEPIAQVRSRGRDVYLGLPTNPFTPRHARREGGCSTGAAWMDTDATFHRAMYFLLADTPFTGTQRAFIHGRDGFVREEPRFFDLRTGINLLASTVLADTRLQIPGSPKDLARLHDWVVEIWTSTAKTSLPPADARRVIPYLLAYKFLRYHHERGSFCANLLHPRIQYIRTRQRGRRAQLRLVADAG